MQRRRLLDAIAEIVGEEGYASASVTAICARAGLSRQTFYQRFDSPRTCFIALLDEAYEQAAGLIIRCFESTTTWREGLCEAFAALLVLFDDRPALARVWMIESITAGPWALAHRERRVIELTDAIVGYWERLFETARPPQPMVAAGVMAAVIAAIQRHLATASTESLLELLGPLMGIATYAFLEFDEVLMEIGRGEQLAREIATGARKPAGRPEREDLSVPARLLDPRAYRARACLLHLAGNAGASNRQIANAAGISSHTQISSLLTRLARMGLAEKEPVRPGYPNVWSLTEKGKSAVAALAQLPA